MREKIINLFWGQQVYAKEALVLAGVPNMGVSLKCGTFFCVCVCANAYFETCPEGVGHRQRYLNPRGQMSERFCS